MAVRRHLWPFRDEPSERPGDVSTRELTAATRLRTAAPARTLEYDLYILKVVSMKKLAKRSVLIAGRRTRVRLGSAMWEALEDIAQQTCSSISALVPEIDRERKQQRLDVAVRDHVVGYYRAIMQVALHGDAGQR